MIDQPDRILGLKPGSATEAVVSTNGPLPGSSFRSLLDELTELAHAARIHDGTSHDPAAGTSTHPREFAAAMDAARIQDPARTDSSPPVDAEPSDGVHESERDPGPARFPEERPGAHDIADTPHDALAGPDTLARDLARAEDQFQFAMDLSRRLREAFEARLQP